MAVINADILLRTLFLEAAFISFLFLAADFGDLTLAANQVLLQFLHITAYALDGFAFSAEALVGLTVGARTRQQLRRAVMLTSLWAGMTVLVLAAGFALFGPLAIDVMTTSPEVRSEARRFLVWIVALPIIGAPSWMLDGIFVGAMRTRDMRNAMLVSVLVYALSLVILVGLLGSHGLWAALLVLFVARAVTLGARYLSLEGTAV